MRGSIVVVAGFAVFLLAGYAAISYRDAEVVSQQESGQMPLYIPLQVIIGSVLLMWGSLLLAGELKPISALDNQEGLDANVFRPDFMSFHHRGSLLPQAIDAIT